ncbi:ABC transporter permease [Actinomadura keratinilytica]
MAGPFLPTRVAGRTAAVAASAARRGGDLARWPVFVYRVLLYSLRDLVWHRRYGRTVARHVSDVVVGAGATVVGGGMIFVIFTMAFFVGTEVGLQGYTGLRSIGAESFMGLVGSFANVREITP